MRLFEHRVAEKTIAQILNCITELPNKRMKPTTEDLVGEFDFWFDGGAGRILTGSTEYVLIDRTRVVVVVSPSLSIGIDFPNGSRVSIQQERHETILPR